MGRRPGPREFAAIGAILLGLTGVALAAPERTTDHASRNGARRRPGGAIALIALLPQLLRRRIGAGAFIVVISAGCGYAWTGIVSKLVTDEVAAGSIAIALAWLATLAASEFVALLSEMSALQRRPATHVAPPMFTVQVLIPVLLAPFLFGESWGDPRWGASSSRASIAVSVAGTASSPPPPRSPECWRRASEGIGPRTVAVTALPLLACGRADHAFRAIAPYPARSADKKPGEGMPPSAPADATRPDASSFAIGFDHRDRARLHQLWTEVLDSEQWSEGPMLARFEQRWTEWNRLPAAVGMSSWAGGALAALEFAGVRGRDGALPFEHLHGDAPGGARAGAEVEFVDCNREDLCMSFADFEAKAERLRPRRDPRPHRRPPRIRGGADRRLLPRAGIFLLEDCAHAHGADWNGRRPGSWGDAGVFSLYATKTISTGEGGVLVTADPELAEFARGFRNYGKPDHDVEGLNFRMSEFTAALGLVGVERLEEIVAWKNDVRARAPRPAPSRPPGAARRHDLGPLQVRRLRARSSAPRARLRRPATGSWGTDVELPEQRLGRREPLVRSPLLPPRRRASAAVGAGMRVLVTGGAGFIGSHVVDRLIERGITPRIFDLSASPYHSPLEVETFTGSITDPANLDLAMRDCDAVIHLAAVADVAQVVGDPVLAEEVNTRGTLNVLESVGRTGVERVVYGSTTWVYSDAEQHAVDEETPIPAPRHLYTATKLAGETYCAGYAELFDLDYTVLRFGIPYGPRARAAGVVARSSTWRSRASR